MTKKPQPTHQPVQYFKSPRQEKLNRSELLWCFYSAMLPNTKRYVMDAGKSPYVYRWPGNGSVARIETKQPLVVVSLMGNVHVSGKCPEHLLLLIDAIRKYTLTITCENNLYTASAGSCSSTSTLFEHAVMSTVAKLHYSGRILFPIQLQN